MSRPLKDLMCINENHEFTCTGCGLSKESLEDALDEYKKLINEEIQKIDKRIDRCGDDLQQKILYLGCKISFQRALGAMEESFPAIYEDR